MSITVSGPNLPTSRTATALSIFKADQSLISKDSESTDRGTRNLTYLYNAAGDSNIPVNLFHTASPRAGAVKTEIGFGGKYAEADSVSGRTLPIARRTWGLWTVQPVGVVDLTPATVQTDLEFLFSLWFTSVTSNVADTGTVKKVLAGARIW